MTRIKQRCALTGCDRRVAPGSRFCAEHATALRSVQSDALLARLCDAMHAVSAGSAPGDKAMSDRQLIDNELRTLYAIRALYLAWLQEQGDEHAEPPTRLLRAWGDSTARVIQLLKARKALEDEQSDGFDAMMASVLDKIDDILACGEPDQ